MSAHIVGMGCITPLGAGVKEVWDQLRRGEQASAETISNGDNRKSYKVFRVPAAPLKDLPVHPRLRRASAISRFAAAAGTAALRDAETTVGTIDPARVALVFAISNGGVIYTKRFYHDVVASDPASPLLFPETVFNAPASHLAALLGVTGPTYSLVGDGAVGLAAVKMGEELLANGSIDFCLVVGAEETDWLLCDAYAKWRLLRAEPPIEAFQHPARGMILSEGAGAIVMAREGLVRIKAVHGGGFYADRTELAGRAESILREVGAASTSAVITSANGTFIDQAELKAIGQVMPEGRVYSLKPNLGESVGASGLWQVIVAATALREQELPLLLREPPGFPFSSVGREKVSLPHVVVLCCGLNQQIAALTLAVE